MDYVRLLADLSAATQRTRLAHERARLDGLEEVPALWDALEEATGGGAAGDMRRGWEG